jgi:hypothetical protein
MPMGDDLLLRHSPTTVSQLPAQSQDHRRTEAMQFGEQAQRWEEG